MAGPGGSAKAALAQAEGKGRQPQRGAVDADEGVLLCARVLGIRLQFSPQRILFQPAVHCRPFCGQFGCKSCLRGGGLGSLGGVGFLAFAFNHGVDEVRHGVVLLVHSQLSYSRRNVAGVSGMIGLSKRLSQPVGRPAATSCACSDGGATGLGAPAGDCRHPAVGIVVSAAPGGIVGHAHCHIWFVGAQGFASGTAPMTRSCTLPSGATR